MKHMTLAIVSIALSMGQSYCLAGDATNTTTQAVAVTTQATNRVDITTRSGKEFKRCKITKVEPDGITVFYAKGIAKINFADLSDEYRTKYGYDQKKAEEYTRMVNLGLPVQWQTDFATASANARKSGLYMLLDFSGSDWCGWCMKLEAEVFSKPEFRQYANGNLVSVLVDFPNEKPQTKQLKAQNAELARKYGIEGYPTVIILSPEGEQVGKTGYLAGGAKNYVDNLKIIIAEYERSHPRN
jgi:protein disulfide-isomerase